MDDLMRWSAISILAAAAIGAGCGLIGAEDDDSDGRSCITVDDGEELEGDTTLDGDCYQIDDPLVITSGETTIAPGTTLYFGSDAGLSFEQSSTLTIGADGDETVELRGDDAELGYWRGIELRGHGPHHIEGARIADAGSSSWSDDQVRRAGLVVADNRVDVAIVDVEFDNNEHAAIVTDAALASMEVTDSRFVNNDVPMRLLAHHPDGLGMGLSFADNRRDVVIVRGDDPLTEDVEWPDLAVSYRVDDIVTVEGRLAVASGTTVEFDRHAGIDVAGGVLDAEASTHDPIRFVGTNDSAGYWRGLRFRSTPSTDISRIAHAVVSHGGSERWDHGWSNSQANVLVDDGGRLAIDHTLIADGDYHGISVRDGYVTGCEGLEYDGLRRHDYHPTSEDDECQ